MPVIIAASLGATVNALFFTSFLFSSTVDPVASNYASPLVIDSAHSPEDIGILIRAALRHIFVIILPVVAALMVMSPWLLRAFGGKYRRRSPSAVAAAGRMPPKALSTVYYAYCRIYRTTNRSAVLQAYVCVTTLSATIVMGRAFGLIGVGVAILSVQSSAAASCWALRRGLRDAEGRGGGPGRHRRPRGSKATTRVGLPAIGG